MKDRKAMPVKSAECPVRHVPVLLAEMLRQLAPKSGEVIIDGTFGAGGYSDAILETGASVIGIDRDPSAIARAKAIRAAKPSRLTLIEGRFGDLDSHARQCGCAHVNGIVLDLGVSSTQLGEAERGFSFQKDGPLDMRMELQGTSAADIVNRMPVRDLIRVIGILGEEKRAPAVAYAIDAARKKGALTRTLQLAAIVKSAVGNSRKSRIDPATRTFQGLRIYVNRELNEVARALLASEKILSEGGRLVVVSFHSIEDRIVKRFFADRSRTHAAGSRHLPRGESPPATFALKIKGAAEPGEAEISANPRARSARLRTGQRTGATARKSPFEALGVPQMPAFEELGNLP